MARGPLLRRLVGAILRTHREAQGRTLRSVAGQARVSVAYLSEIERGRKEPSSEVLDAVCDALGMGLVDLLADVHGALVGPALTGTAPTGTAPTEPAPTEPALTGHPLTEHPRVVELNSRVMSAVGADGRRVATNRTSAGPVVLLHAA